MAKITHKLKLAWLKGVEVLGTTASNLASNAKFKVAEINLETQYREIMSEFTQQAYELWQQGTVFPEPLNGMLKNASDLNERLNLLRAEHYVAIGGRREKDEEGKSAQVDSASAEAPAQETLQAPNDPQEEEPPAQGGND